jgi:hypothetical protein
MTNVGPDQHGVFGNLASIPSMPYSITLIAFFFFLMIMEIIVNSAENWARLRGLLVVFEKLQKELMMMGVVSFIVFCLTSFWIEGQSLNFTLELETAEITSLFMAVAFVLQASLLVSYASFAGKSYQWAARLSPEALINLYEDMNTDSWEYWLFHYLPSCLPCWPSFRADIEFRIIERLFIANHNLPAEFNFANYLTVLFSVRLLRMVNIYLFKIFKPINLMCHQLHTIYKYVRMDISYFTLTNTGLHWRVGPGFIDQLAAPGMSCSLKSPSYRSDRSECNW